MILILDDQRCQTAGKTLTFSLKKAFDKVTDVVNANAETFLRHIETSNPSTIIIPEIKGETNYYPEYLGDSGKKIIRKAVAEGALYVGFCAGAYNACSQNIYTPDGRPHKLRDASQLLDLTSIQAKGPIPGFGKTMDANTHKEHGHSCELVPIILKQGDRVTNETVWYENGPLFHLNGLDVPKECDVIARYNLDTKYPAAVLVIEHKKGKVLLSGVLPHLHIFDTKMDHPLWTVIKDRIRNHMTHFNHLNRITSPS